MAVERHHYPRRHGRDRYTVIVVVARRFGQYRVPGSNLLWTENLIHLVRLRRGVARSGCHDESFCKGGRFLAPWRGGPRNLPSVGRRIGPHWAACRTDDFYFAKFFSILLRNHSLVAFSPLGVKGEPCQRPISTIRLVLSWVSDAASKVTVMNMMSQASYEEIVLRAGMQVCGGNLSLLPHADPVSDEAAGTAAWAGPRMGLFVVESQSQLS
jgi:hypothetical protein